MFSKGRMTGLEPANGGTTTHCLNHLATLAKLSYNMYMYIRITFLGSFRLYYFSKIKKIC